MIGTTGSAFLPLGGTHNAVVGLHITPVMIVLNQRLDRPAPMRGLSASGRAARIAANPQRAAALRQGRQRLAAAIGRQNEGMQSLAGLRLAAGLSQAELAARMDMQQPNVARLERRPGDPSMTTIQRMARALSVELSDVVAAIEATNKAAAHE